MRKSRGELRSRPGRQSVEGSANCAVLIRRKPNSRVVLTLLRVTCQRWNAEKKNQAQAVLLAISREFGKSVDWLLTGKTHVEPKKRVAKDPAELG